MKFRLALITVSLLMLSGCTTIDVPDTEGRTTNLPDPQLKGVYSFVLHNEINQENVILFDLILRDSTCGIHSCMLDGYAESEMLGRFERYEIEQGYFYPDSRLIKFNFEYITLLEESRTVKIFIDEFFEGHVPTDAMAGQFHIFSRNTATTFFNDNDKTILAEARKGKTIRAGNLTAWRTSDQIPGE